MRPFTSARFAATISIVGAVLLICSQVHAAPVAEIYGPVQPIPRTSPVAGGGTATRTIYVNDYRHLAELTTMDEAVHGQAISLARRQTASYIVGYGGQLFALALFLSGATFLGGHDCSPNGYCLRTWNMPVMWSGVAVMSSSVVTALILRPSRRDLLNLINDWNSRHVDEPLTIDTQPAWWLK